MNGLSFGIVIFLVISVLQLYNWSARAQTSGVNRECSKYVSKRYGNISKASEGN